MGTKILKISIYTIIGCLVTVFILKQAGSGDFTTIYYILYGIAILAGLVIATLSILISIDNKKVNKMINDDKYDDIASYAKSHLERKHMLFADRVQYYYYLLLLVAFAKDNKDDIDLYYEKLDTKNLFPISYYWKACYDFANNLLDNVKENLDLFRNSDDVRKKYLTFANMLKVVDSILLYIDNKYVEAKEKVEEIDSSKISMPATLRCIDIIKNTINN